MDGYGLRIICEPLFNDNTLLKKEYSEKDLVESGFFRKEIRVCIPLGTIEAYHHQDETALFMISEYIQKTPPHFTSVRFTDEKGQEPAYVHISSFVEKENDIVWNKVYLQWPRLLKKLIGNNVCYLSGNLLLQRDLKNRLPKDYDGKIIYRGANPEVPVLIECTKKFIDLGDAELRAGIMDANIWTYGTWAYILPKKNEFKLSSWASSTACNREIVQDFFESIIHVFWVQYELEGIWIMTHKIDSQTICNHLEVDKLNDELNKKD